MNLLQVPGQTLIFAVFCLSCRKKRTFIAMKYFFLTILLIFSWQIALPQISTIPPFGTDSTLDIATWNIEHFPKNGTSTINYVSQILQQLDLDVVALQEIDDTVSFKQILNDLPDYQFYCKSSYYGGLAYLYKKDIISINALYEIYTTSPYWSPFPRAPQVMDMSYLGNSVFIFDNHFKCCGDGILDLTNTGDEETRRFRASNYIKEYIDTYLPDNNVIFVGDLNDILTDQTANNVFINLINDTEGYRFADMDIAQGSSSHWSYPSWPSHLDHVLITNELFDEFQQPGSEIKAIKIDEYLTNGWYEYDNNVSDHRPVAIKFKMSSTLGFEEIAGHDLFTCNPNPATDVINFHFKASDNTARIVITEITGKTVAILPLSKNQTDISLQIEGFRKGIYVARLLSTYRIAASRKIVVY